MQIKYSLYCREKEKKARKKESNKEAHDRGRALQKSKQIKKNTRKYISMIVK